MRWIDYLQLSAPVTETTIEAILFFASIWLTFAWTTARVFTRGLRRRLNSDRLRRWLELRDDEPFQSRAAVWVVGSVAALTQVLALSLLVVYASGEKASALPVVVGMVEIALAVGWLYLVSRATIDIDP